MTCMKLSRRISTLVIVLFCWAIVVSSPAWAKGPVAVEIAGPGLDEPLVLDVNSAERQLEAMWALAEQVQLYTPAGTAARPQTGDFGTAYRLTWHMSEADGDRILQDVYPFAAGGPVVHTLPGSTSWQELVPAGWAAASAGLPEALTRLGVPLSQPAQADANVPAPATMERNPVEPAPDRPWLAIFAVVAALIAVVGVVTTVMRRHATLRV
jgi:hypothetical protein